MMNQAKTVSLADFMDCRMKRHNEISRHGITLLAHANYTLIKFFQAFKKTNILMVTKTASLCNNIISFSKDQLKQTKGLDMMPSEKTELRGQFNSEKHHLVIAMNVFMYLCRHEILILDAQASQCKRF